jgi:TetR/AcrR family transcriptional regulator, ethionamide resistance regulator
VYGHLVSPSRSRPRARRSVPQPATADLRERLLTATRELLSRRRFDSISVADIIAAAGVSRASFYFYFQSKQDILAELVRRAVDQGQQAARPWTDGRQDPVDALRSGIAAGAALWRDNAGVLAAIVENWGTDEQLRSLWLEQMDRFTDITIARIRDDAAVLRHLNGLDVRAVAASLTWLGERLYYLAATDVPPFNDHDTLVNTLTHAWARTLYGTG